MTQASTARVERRLNGQHANPVIEGRAFPLPPAGMMSEQVVLPDFGLSLGLIHPDDCPLMIAAWDGQRVRRLLPEQASKWADEIALTPGLSPVVEAIRKLVRRVGEVVTVSIMRTEGNA